MNWTMNTSAVIYNDSSKSLQYREVGQLLLDWCKKNSDQYKSLSKLAKMFLCIPVSSARPSVWVFSVTGLTVNKLRTSLLAENVNTACHVAQQRRFVIWLTDWSLLCLHLIGGVKFRVYNSIAYGRPILDGLEKRKLCYLLLQCVRLLPTNFHNFWHTLISYGVCAQNYMKFGWQ